MMLIHKAPTSSMSWSSTTSVDTPSLIPLAIRNNRPIHLRLIYTRPANLCIKPIRPRHTHPAHLQFFNLTACSLPTANRIFHHPPAYISHTSVFPFSKPTSTTPSTSMGIKFIRNNLSNEPASPTAHDLQSSTIVKASSLKDLIPRGPASVGSSDVSDPSGPKSPAVTGTCTDHPSGSENLLRCELPASPISDGDEHLENSSAGCASSQKTSYLWRKTMYEYFKSDDDDTILTPDDEWWLGSNIPLADNHEPPSGKTRPIKREATEWPEENPSDESDPVSAHRTARLKCSAEATSPAIEETPETECRSSSSDGGTNQPASSSSLASVSLVKTSASSSIFTAAEFPPPPGTQTEPGPATVKDHFSFRLPDGPWKISNQRSPSPEYPSLQSPTRPQPSYPTTRLVCSFSSATTQTAKQPQPSTFKADGKEPKRSEADRREETLKATLPAFKLEDPAFSSHTVTLCPSAQHPISELPQLIKLLCNDGISLPSGRPELEGGPYVAVAFDMEWTISWTRGHENRTAVLQLASRTQVLIVQISSDSAWLSQGIMPDSLVDFLVNPQIVKIGVGIRNDGLKLLRDHKLGQKPFLNSFLELSRLVRALGQPDCASGYSRLISLQQIVADYLEVYLPKVDTRTSDWARPLTEAQLGYAASDVVATIRVSQNLFKLFEGRIRKADSGLMILQYIESLEPTFERSAPPTQPLVPFSWEDYPKPCATKALPPLKRRCPVVPISKDKGQYTSPDLSSATLKPKEHVEPCTSEARASSLPQLAVPHKLKDNSLPELKKGPVHTKRKQWLTIIPSAGPQSIEVKKQWVVKPANFLAPTLKSLKHQVPLGVQEAWELWYHRGLAVSQCSKALSLSPVTFASRIGKMLIHLKLNKLTLDDYYYNRIKTLIANPQAFAELASSCQSQVDVAGKKAEADCGVDACTSVEVARGTLTDTVACCDDKRQEPSHGDDGLGEALDQSTSAPDKTAQSSSDKIVVSMPVSSSDHKGPENSPTVQKPVSSMSNDLEPTPTVLPKEKSTSCLTDQTAENSSVIVKTSPLFSDDEAGSNFHEDNKPEQSPGGQSWYEETESCLRGEHMGLNAAEPPIAETGDWTAKQEHEAKADEHEQEAKADEHDAKADEHIEKGQATKKIIKTETTKNFRIDDTEFLTNKTLDLDPLFDEQELERIRQINKDKTELLDSLISNVRVPQRLRTSQNYFNLS
ncbi:hypothetical protein PSTG_00198 [Puccinia striiformis f. sp. tritici PST-78]|uniref:3'-5' exonuclease domain-containing protein n=1 Tax=Puccinia striiformis f. sp. tritici PST-78 TaxID=1165861 RepID=A0A0L0W5W0_9BASI|nr:hypothetical protein PSTG_00198 [Puccinia striiformis f. sp. tritici PST-78]